MERTDLGVLAEKSKVRIRDTESDFRRWASISV